MPTVVTETPYRSVPVEPRRKRWTRAECDALEKLGAWDQEHLELVQGELISKMGKKRPHVGVHAFVFAWFIDAYGKQYVNSEAPVDVAPEDNPTSEPEPDVIVLTKATSEIRANPQPSELRLVAEISDSTLGFDLTTKAELYARAGIIEYWVLDVAARKLIVHRDPSGGLYRSVNVYTHQESVAPLSLPDREFRVADAFPE